MKRSHEAPGPALVLLASLLLAGPAGATVFTVNDAGSATDATPGDGLCATAGGVCTLRAAVDETNALAAGAPHEIRFAGAMTSTIADTLVVTRTGTVIDGVTGNPAFAGTPVVEVVPQGAFVHGIHATGGSATIRGLVVRGFEGSGVLLQSSGNVVLGCHVGTNAAGTAAAPNSSVGIDVFGAADNVVGGTSAGEGNLVSGNGVYGIIVRGGATGTLIRGNRIGVDVTGTAALPNGTGGIYVTGSGTANTVIGGSAPGARNVIGGHSAGTGFGIRLSGSGIPGVTGTVVQGNYVGTNATGTAAIPNELGVDFSGGSGSTVGGSGAGEGNVISGNANTGLRISGSDGNVVRGNVIGLNASGTAALGNGNQGLRIDNSTGNQIGFGSAGSGNVISGNADVAIRLTNATDTLVTGNTLGLDAAGTSVVNNAGGGVHVFGGTRNWITENRIASTGTGLAIDLDADGTDPPDGVTPNDPLDADTGPNDLQNFPVLTSALAGAGTTTVAGTLQSLPSTTFDVELFSSPSCHSSGHGDARTYLGSVSVTTDGGGDAAIAYVHGAALAPGSVVTATATPTTGTTGNTSELSACAVVAAAPLPDLTVAKTHSGTFVRGQVGATYTITVTNAGSAPTVGTTTVADLLPAGLTATAFAGSGWSCTLSPLQCASAAVVGPAASFPPITLTVDVAANAASSVTNTVTVSGGGQFVTTNDTANDLTAIAAGPDLTAAKTHAGSFQAGQVGATYTITVTNAGDAPTVGTTTVVDALPAGLTATAFAGSGWSCTLSPLQCASAAAVAAGASFPPVTLTVSVAANATGSLVNSVAVSGGGDVNGANNTATDATAIGAAPGATIPVAGPAGLAALAAAILAAGVLALRR